MDKALKDKLRLLKLDSLSLLHVLSVSDSVALELKQISDSTNTSEPDLKGIISSIRRLKIDDESWIVPAGRDNEGRLRWQINQAIIDKKELAKFLEEEILGEIKY